MNQKRNIFILLALAAIASMFAFLVLPSLLARGVQNKIGNGLVINGPVRLVVMPIFGIVANDVDVTTETGKLKAAIKAPSAEIQIPLQELLFGTLRPSKITIMQAEIAVTLSDDNKTELQPDISPASLIEINDSTLMFGTTKFESVSAKIETTDTGETDIKGVFLHDAKLGNFALNLASIRRLSEDGSPFDGVIGYNNDSLTLSGQLKFLDGFSFSGRGDLTSDDKTLKVSGALAGTDQLLQWPNGDVAIMGMNARGPITISRNEMNASLAMRSLAVSNFDGLWSEIPFWELGRTGRFDLQIQDLSFRDIQLRKSTVRVSVNDKSSEIKLMTADGLQGQFNLKTADDGKTFDLKLSGQNTELSKLAPLVFSRGKMGFDLDFRSSGKSPAEVLSKLSGTARIDLKDGEILGADIADFMGSVSREVITGWPNKTEKSLRVRTASVTFKIADGIATTQDLAFAGSDYQVIGRGEIDLLRAAVDLIIDPVLIADDKTKRRLPVEIAIVGPWGIPQIQPDIEGILTDPRTAFARLKSEGLVSANQKRQPKK